MWQRIWRAGPVLLLIVSGCAGPMVDTVPWWKGIPCMMIAPSSLEGMVWRDHFRERHHQRRAHHAAAHAAAAYGDGWAPVEFYFYGADAVPLEVVEPALHPPFDELPPPSRDEHDEPLNGPFDMPPAELPGRPSSARVLPAPLLELP